jgi:hypothetical protein
MVVNNGSFEFGGFDFKPEFYKESCEPLFDNENSVYLDNVHINELDALVMIYGNKKKSGGCFIQKHEYDENSQRLTIFYDDENTVENVIKFGQVQFDGKIYVAQINRPSIKCEEINKPGNFK